MELNKRVTILTGHFGSGKTEIAINLALNEKKLHNKTAINDLDIINPYFRSRDVSDIFEQQDIELIAPANRLATSDLPIVSGEIYRILHHLCGFTKWSQLFCKKSSGNVHQALYEITLGRIGVKAVEKRVVFNEGICKSCGLCVQVCPTNVIFLADYLNGKGYRPAEALNKGASLVYVRGIRQS
jgi:ferredoxin